MDCSQTLYEFRASNPKALNVLENSGVFDTYKLQTNYRSNQEILDFANVLLGTIEANKYANIQLKANSLAPVTAQSFKDAVTVKYERLLNKSPQAYNDMISHTISVDAKPYIDDKLAKDEQIAILAPARRTLWAVEKVLKNVYPNAKIASLIPQRQYDNAVFSRFIARYWNSIKYTPPTNLIATIRQTMLANINMLMYSRNPNKLQQSHDLAKQMLDEFQAQYGGTILNWQQQVLNSVMPQADLLAETKRLMIAFEIKRNNMAQALLSAKNAERKRSNDVADANFLISTIHSAKGLEFDNVITFYASESESTIDDATKRMYYVALTRAKKTEFIMSYDTLARPKILGDYEKIIKDLEKKQQNACITDDNDDDDDGWIKIHPDNPS